MRYITFGSIYFVQGVALAYLQNFQKPYLNQSGVSPAAVGLLTSILLLPFVLKIALGLISDRFNLFGLGHRRPYILLGLLLAGGGFAAASLFTPDARFLAYGACILLGAFGVTLFDSATDGHAVESTPPERRGLVQGIMVGSRAGAVIALSLVFGFIATKQGYGPVFWIIGAVMLIPFVIALFMREGRTEATEFQWSAFRTLLRPPFLWFTLYALAYSFVSFGTDGQITYYMSREFATDDITATIGKYASLKGVGAAVGGFVGGVLMDKLGHKRSAMVVLGLLFAGGVGLSLATDLDQLIIAGVIWGVAWGMQKTVYFCLAMDVCSARIAGCMFAILMAISNLATAIAEGVVTPLAASESVGFVVMFRVLAIFNVVTLIVLLAYFKSKRKHDAAEATA